MHFAVLPPEVNSGRMYAGPGAEPMLAAAAAWDELANELHTAAANVEAVISELGGESWQGPSSESMTAAAAPQVAWLSDTATQANQTGAQARAAAAAYEAAYAMTVPPAVVAANRAQLDALVATNLLGQNTPAIAATEVAYGEMWAQDVTAMYGYAGAARTAATVRPFEPPRHPAADATAQNVAVTRATATAAGQAQETLSNNAFSAVPNALQALTSSSGSSGLTAFSEFTNPYDLATLGSGLLGNGVGLIGLSGAAGFISDAEQKVTAATAPAGDKAAPGPRAADTAAATRSADNVAAGLGRADSLGAMSVPQGWTKQAPEVRLSALEIPAPAPTGGARPALLGQLPLLGGAPLMGLPGRDRGAAPVTGPEEHGGATSRVRPGNTAGGEPVPRGLAVAELREITDVLGKLTNLRDAGALTPDEFVEQKRRLLGG